MRYLYKLSSIFFFKSANVTLEETLDELEVSDETKEYVIANKNKAHKYIAILKKFPDADPEELEAALYKSEPSKSQSNKEMIDSNMQKIMNLIIAEENEEKINNAESIIKLDIPAAAKPWAIKQVLDNYNISDIISTLKYFFKNITYFPQRDVNQYKNIKEIEDLSKQISAKRNEKIKGNVDPIEAPIVWENEDFLLIRPETKNACINIGRGTQWCITMTDATYYEDYTRKNTLFYFLIRKNREGDEFDKVAFALIRDEDNEYKGSEIYDNEDSSISLEELAQEIGPIASQINEIIMKDSPNHFKGKAKIKAEIKSGEMSPGAWATTVLHEYYENSQNYDEFDLYDYLIDSIPQEYVSHLFSKILSEHGYSLLQYDEFSQLMNMITEDDYKELADYWDDLDYSHKTAVINSVDPSDVEDLFSKEIKYSLKDNYSWIIDDLMPIAFERMESKDLAKYIDHDEEEFRKNVAWNIDKEYLPKMINDKSEEVREIVSKRIDPKYLPDMLNLQGSLPFNPKIPSFNDDIEFEVLANIVDRIDPMYFDYLIKKYKQYKLLAQKLLSRLPANDKRTLSFINYAQVPEFQQMLLNKLPIDKLHLLNRYIPEDKIKENIMKRTENDYLSLSQ